METSLYKNLKNLIMSGKPIYDQIDSSAPEAVKNVLTEQDMLGNSLLHWVVYSDNPYIVKLFLELGIKYDLLQAMSLLQNNQGNTPFLLALFRGKVNAAKAMVPSIFSTKETLSNVLASQNECEVDPIMKIVDNDNREIFREMSKQAKLTDFVNELSKIAQMAADHNATDIQAYIINSKIAANVQSVSKDLLNILANVMANGLGKAILETQAKLELTERKENAAKNALDVIKSEKDAEKKTLDTVTNEVVAAKTALDTLTNEVAAVKAPLDILTHETAAAKTRLDTVTKETATTKAQLDAVTREVAAAKAQLDASPSLNVDRLPVSSPHSTARVTRSQAKQLANKPHGSDAQQNAKEANKKFWQESEAKLKQAEKSYSEKRSETVEADKSYSEKLALKIQTKQSYLAKHAEKVQAEKDHLAKQGLKTQAEKDHLAKQVQEDQAEKDHLAKQGLKTQAEKDHLAKQAQFNDQVFKAGLIINHLPQVVDNLNWSAKQLGFDLVPATVMEFSNKYIAPFLITGGGLLMAIGLNSKLVASSTVFHNKWVQDALEERLDIEYITPLNAVVTTGLVFVGVPAGMITLPWAVGLAAVQAVNYAFNYVPEDSSLFLAKPAIELVSHAVNIAVSPYALLKCINALHMVRSMADSYGEHSEQYAKLYAKLIMQAEKKVPITNAELVKIVNQSDNSEVQVSQTYDGTLNDETCLHPNDHCLHPNYYPFGFLPNLL